MRVNWIEARKGAGISQTKMAGKLHMARQSYRELEQGIRKKVPADILLEFCKIVQTQPHPDLCIVFDSATVDVSVARHPVTNELRSKLNTVRCKLGLGWLRMSRELGMTREKYRDIEVGRTKTINDEDLERLEAFIEKHSEEGME